MGRRKIEIKPILNDRNRSVTFVKRKNGLFKKAFELGVLCSVDVAVIIFEERAGGHVKLHEYCSTDVDSMIQRHLSFDGERESKRPIDFNKNANDDEGLGPEDEEDDDDDMGGHGASGSRRAGGNSGVGAGYGGGGSGFMRPGPLATGSRSSSGADHGGMSGAGSSRSAGMGMGYNTGYKPMISYSSGTPLLPPHSHPSLQTPTHSYSHPPAYGQTSSSIPFSQERGAGSSSYYTHPAPSKRPRLEYPGPSPYTINDPYLQGPGPPQQHSAQSPTNQDTLFTLGAAFGRPTPSPSSATGSHTGGARGSAVYAHGSTSPHHQGTGFVGMLGGEAVSPPSATGSGRGHAGHSDASSFAWPIPGEHHSHAHAHHADAGPASHSDAQSARAGVGVGVGGGGGGGGGGAGTDMGWLDFLDSAPGQASGAGASSSPAGHTHPSSSHSSHHQHAPHPHPHSAGPTPLPDAPSRLGKRTRSDSDSFAEDEYRERDEIGTGTRIRASGAEGTSTLGLKQEPMELPVPLPPASAHGESVSVAYRARVENDLEHFFGTVRSAGPGHQHGHQRQERERERVSGSEMPMSEVDRSWQRGFGPLRR